MKSTKPDRRNQGQVLIIVALVITLILFSTAVYTAEIQRRELIYQASFDQEALAVQQGLRHTMISALANISNGGNYSILTQDINRFNSLYTANSYNSIVKISSSQNGSLINWGTDGAGISGVYATYSLASTSSSTNLQTEFTLNVNSTLEVAGNYTVNGADKTANVTFLVGNDGQAALAKNWTIYYEADGNLATEEWVKVTTLAATDFGNGTYTASFTVQTLNPSDPLLVLVECLDFRGVLVKASVACNLQ